MGKLFTQVITNDTLTITAAMGFTNLSLRLQSGTVTVTGTEKAGLLSSAAITMVDGVPITVSDQDALDGVVIDASSGVVEVLAIRGGFSPI